VAVANSSLIGGYAPNAYVPTQFQEDIDVAQCALDEQLERLQPRARFEIESLERRDDIPEHIINQAKRQRAAAETRCARLLSAIEGLEDRLENE
jgi:hypothetical protein